MVRSAGDRRRAQLAALGAAAVLSVAGGVIWSQRSSGDDVDAVLDEPGKYVEPGASTNPSRTGDAFPDVELESPAGEPAALTSDGRPMVVNVWFSACAPCAREMADFAAVERDVGSEIRFVGVNPNDDAVRMREFARERDVGYELWRDPTFDFVDEMRLAGFPATFLVDTDGTIVEQHGVLDEAELRAIITERFGVGG
jgi:peroxiredoxin